MVNQKTASVVLLTVVCAGVIWASGVIPAIVPAAVPTANKQGNGTKFQLSTGSTTTDNCAKFDANGNTVDAGGACGGGGGGGGAVITGPGLSLCIDPGPFNVPGSTEIWYAFETGVIGDPYDPPAPPSTAGTAFTTIPRDGTLRKFYVTLVGTQPVSGALTLTIMINGVDTAVVVVVPPLTGSVVASDVTHSVAVSAGDFLTVHILNAAATPSVGVYAWSIALD